MTTKHTPGPWTLPVGVIGIDKVWDAEGDFEIANLYTAGRIGWEQTEANARLIALAPEMVEEFRNIEANLTGRDCFPERVADSLRRCAAILSKLESGQ